MSKGKELAGRVTDLMRLMADENEWPIKFELVERIVDQTVSSWVDDVESEIQSLIKDWETKMEDDSSLYTLGLRRALDVVKGHSSIA